MHRNRILCSSTPWSISTCGTQRRCNAQVSRISRLAVLHALCVPQSAPVGHITAHNAQECIVSHAASRGCVTCCNDLLHGTGPPLDPSHRSCLCSYPSRFCPCHYHPTPTPISCSIPYSTASTPDQGHPSANRAPSTPVTRSCTEPATTAAAQLKPGSACT